MSKEVASASHRQGLLFFPSGSDYTMKNLRKGSEEPTEVSTEIMDAAQVSDECMHESGGSEKTWKARGKQGAPQKYELPLPAAML